MLALLLRDEALQTVVRVIHILFSVVFLIDFLARFRRAPSRRDYVFRQFGWADLLASLPFPQFKILRVFRLSGSRDCSDASERATSVEASSATGLGAP